MKLPDRFNPFVRLLDRYGCSDGEKKYLSMGFLNASGSIVLASLVRTDFWSVSLAYLCIVLINYKWVRLAWKREECLNCGRIKLPKEMSLEKDEFGCVVCKRCCRRVETRKRIRDQRRARTVQEQTVFDNWRSHPEPAPPKPDELFPERPRFSGKRAASEPVQGS